MDSMNKYVIGIALAIIVIGGVFYYVASHGSQQTTPPPSPAPLGGAVVATSTYTGSNFTIVYPADFTVDPSYHYDQVSPTKPIYGVKFTIPMEMATGTNLAADSYLSVESLPHAKNCTGDIYLAANVTPTSLTDGGATYSFASNTGAAAGNQYAESVYAITGRSPCTAVRYFIHTTDIANYPPGTVQQFDQAKLMSTFDGIRRTLMLTAGSPAATTTNP